MSRRSWILLGALAIVAVVLGAAWVRWDASAGPPPPSASPAAAAPATTSPIGIPTSTTDPTLTPDPTADPDPGESTSAAPPAQATPVPRTSGPPRLAYTQFISRVLDDRAAVETLNAALSSAAQAQDPAAVRHAAVDILDFVDTERDWLRENPPVECYAAAHESAGAMLEAYGAAADSFIAWAETGGGFAGLGALGKAVDAAETASDALTTFGQVMQKTECLD